MTCYPNRVLICHNVAFDLASVAHELALHDRYYLYNQWINQPRMCTMLAAAPYVHPNKKWPKLNVLHKFLGFGDVVQTHRALDDVNMLIQCYDGIMERQWI